MNSLPINLRKLRAIHGYSQEGISEKINVSRSTYSRYESGVIEPPLQTLIQLADIYNVSLDSMVDREFPEFINDEVVQNAIHEVEDKIVQLKEVLKSHYNQWRN